MLTLQSPQVVQETVLRWKRDHKIAFVCTMGCLHEAHLTLVRRAKVYGQKVIVSIFVNPLQFSPGEDFDKYPRTLESDAQALEALGVDMLFAPTREDLYPQGFCTGVQVGKLSQHLCGKFRPGHFEGVATVVLKLFQVVQPDFAVFGEKDFQQLRIVQQMTADLNLPVTILPHETVREEDGVARSSRNRFLSPEERRRAAAIPEAMRLVRDLVQHDPGVRASEVVEKARGVLLEAGLAPEYVEIASPVDLSPARPDERVGEVPGARLFIAARAGGTRLIDNGPVFSDGVPR